MKKNVQGYTLVEMLVVIGITLATLGSLVSAIMLFYRTNLTTLQQAYGVQSARQGIQSTVRDIRGIQYGSDGSYPIASTSANSFSFYSDENGDGIPEKIRYFLSGTDLKQGVIYSSGNPPVYGGNETLKTEADGVQNVARGVSLFRYYNASSTELFAVSTTTAIAYVTVTLVVNEKPGTVQDYTLRSTAALRNVSQF